MPGMATPPNGAVGYAPGWGICCCGCCGMMLTPGGITCGAITCGCGNGLNTGPRGFGIGPLFGIATFGAGRSSSTSSSASCGGGVNCVCGCANVGVDAG